MRLPALALSAVLAFAAMTGGVAVAPAGATTAAGSTAPAALRPVDAAAVTAASRPADVAASDLPGAGTPDDPYVITNASELQAMEDDLDASYVLGADVDASETAGWHGGKGFDPVGTDRLHGGRGFTGSLDGAGHTITGLTIRRPDESKPNAVGLFGSLSASPALASNPRATVANVTLVDATIRGPDTAGGLVGTSVAGTVRNASVNGTVAGGWYVGGLVGENADGTVTGSHATATVTGSSNVGGLVGRNAGTVNRSSATGTVDGYASVGGLVGDNAEGRVTRSSATGGVNGSARVGGLVGENAGGPVAQDSGTVSASYATGRVNGSARVGGLVGYNTGAYAAVRESYATGDVTGRETVGGLVGRNSGGRIRASYARGAVDGSSNVGGLLGRNGRGGRVHGTYATGAVTGTERVGGLVGYNAGGKYRSVAFGATVVNRSYWDVNATGRSASAGTDVAGLATARMTGDAARSNMTAFGFYGAGPWVPRAGDYPVLAWQTDALVVPPVDGDIAPAYADVVAFSPGGDAPCKLCGEVLPTPVFGNERVNVCVLDDGVGPGDVAPSDLPDDRCFNVVVGHGRVRAVGPEKLDDPSLSVRMNETTLAAVTSADDPRRAARRRYERGAIELRGVGPANGLKVGLVEVGARIVDSLT